MRLSTAMLGTVFAVGFLSPAHAALLTVTEIAPDRSTPLTWGVVSNASGGQTSIENLTGAGGNLENNQPLPTGAARLALANNTSSKAEIGIANGATTFGTVRDVLETLEISYSYFKTADSGTPFPAPSLKIEVFNPNATTSGDGFGTLVFEPTWNQTGFEGSSVAVASGVWTDVSIDFDSGLFWDSAFFGTTNAAGGPTRGTLENYFNNTLGGGQSLIVDEFLAASITSINLGLGSNNPNEVGYIDNVRIAIGDFDTTFNFETPTTVSEPAPFALFGIGLLGLAAMRRRKKA